MGTIRSAKNDDFIVPAPSCAKISQITDNSIVAEIKTQLHLQDGEDCIVFKREEKCGAIFLMVLCGSSGMFLLKNE